MTPARPDAASAHPAIGSTVCPSSYRFCNSACDMQWVYFRIRGEVYYYDMVGHESNRSLLTRQIISALSLHLGHHPPSEGGMDG